ncbi:MAG: hypothetical protein HOK80_00740 [Candidatus Cloacimonetes bacterium]|jgi:hypothetical protein|nr:hypothetical protein [Candidatus Cloacimonadota bacterium]MBT7929495.1 hypothetical protein [Candidatus Peregrinibacteria bacterium]
MKNGHILFGNCQERARNEAKEVAVDIGFNAGRFRRLFNVVIHINI